MRPRIVIDTSVYVSGVIYPQSVPRRAITTVWTEGVPLLSVPTWDELRTVFQKSKLARLTNRVLVQSFLDQVWAISELVPIPDTIRACRDPRDDKFLSLAVHGRADLLITGDTDLLCLDPFRGVAIVTPADFLAR